MLVATSGKLTGSQVRSCQCSAAAALYESRRRMQPVVDRQIFLSSLFSSREREVSLQRSRQPVEMLSERVTESFARI